MKKIMKRVAAAILTACMMLGLVACGGEKKSASGSTDTSEIANDYYLDLTELGMKLTVYLRLDAEGSFMFSNTLDFEADKSSGTFQKSGEEYIMVFTSVNGEEKSSSDGITSSFVVTEDGSLDFSGCATVPYGSANISTTSADDPNVKLIAHAVTEEFDAPSTESLFQSGSYTTEIIEENGVYYTHVVSFYEDNTYLHFMSYEQNGKTMFFSETGTYGISTTQLALEPANGERVECEIVDGSNIVVSIYPHVGAAERTSMNFEKVSTVGMLTSFTGTGTVTGTSDTFSTELTIYEDGSYETTAEGFTESGILVLNSEDSFAKQYPDHPETGARGLNQVTTVPAGTVTSDGSVTITDIRVRTSDNLTRYACTVTE